MLNGECSIEHQELHIRHSLKTGQHTQSGAGFSESFVDLIDRAQ